MLNDMERHFIVSSQFDYISYSKEEELLEVEFKNGALYSYDGVSSTTFEFFLAALSKGKFFNAYIRDKYPTTCVRK